VHIISRKRLKEAAREHADLESPLDTWFRIAKRAEWRSLAEVRKTYPTADAVGRHTVFNIKGNNYRLIVEINYRTQRIFVGHVLTHEEYDEERWKS
jgi:mRNA interferase HigB